MGTLLEMPALVQGTQPMELLLALITLAILWFSPSAVKRSARRSCWHLWWAQCWL